jgi:cytochrome c oxidase subunit 4
MTDEHKHTEKQQHHEEEHIVSYKDNLSTWIALIILTLLTVSVSVFSASLVTLTVLTAMIIATTKALVVAYYFMHLKYDRKMYRWMVLLTMVIFAVMIILTAIDYLFR